MGRGAHAAHAAYNGSGTQGLSVTDKINENEEIKSVFVTENDTTKQIVHGCNISEMKCSGKSESVTSERYKIFTPDENADMIGDIYLNFEMDSEISNFEFVDTAQSNLRYPLQKISQEDLTTSFTAAGAELKSMELDLTTREAPREESVTLNMRTVNKIKTFKTSNISFQIAVGRDDKFNVAWRYYGSPNPNENGGWYYMNITQFVEVNDVIYDPAFIDSSYTYGDVSGSLIYGGYLRENLIGKSSGLYFTNGVDTSFNKKAAPVRELALTNRNMPGAEYTEVLTLDEDGFNAIAEADQWKYDHYVTVNTLNHRPGSGFIISGKIYGEPIINTSYVLNHAGSLRYLISQLFFDVIHDAFHIWEEDFDSEREVSSILSINDNGIQKTLLSCGTRYNTMLGLDTSGLIIRSDDNGETWKHVEFYYGRGAAANNVYIDENGNSHRRTTAAVKDDTFTFADYDSGTYIPGQDQYYDYTGSDPNFEYFMPKVSQLHTNNTGVWTAIGQQGIQSVNLDDDVTPRDENDKYRQFVFRSIDDGETWHPIRLFTYPDNRQHNSVQFNSIFVDYVTIYSTDHEDCKVLMSVPSNTIMVSIEGYEPDLSLHKPNDESEPQTYSKESYVLMTIANYYGLYPTHVQELPAIGSPASSPTEPYRSTWRRTHHMITPYHSGGPLVGSTYFGIYELTDLWRPPQDRDATLDDITYNFSGAISDSNRDILFGKNKENLVSEEGVETTVDVGIVTITSRKSGAGGNNSKIKTITVKLGTNRIIQNMVYTKLGITAILKDSSNSEAIKYEIIQSSNGIKWEKLKGIGDVQVYEEDEITLKPLFIKSDLNSTVIYSYKSTNGKYRIFKITPDNVDLEIDSLQNELDDIKGLNYVCTEWIITGKRNPEDEDEYVVVKSYDTIKWRAKVVGAEFPIISSIVVKDKRLYEPLAILDETDWRNNKARNYRVGNFKSYEVSHSASISDSKGGGIAAYVLPDVSVSHVNVGRESDPSIDGKLIQLKSLDVNFGEMVDTNGKTSTNVNDIIQITDGTIILCGENKPLLFQHYFSVGSPVGYDMINDFINLAEGPGNDGLTFIEASSIYKPSGGAPSRMGMTKFAKTFYSLHETKFLENYCLAIGKNWYGNGVPNKEVESLQDMRNASDTDGLLALRYIPDPSEFKDLLPGYYYWKFIFGTDDPNIKNLTTGTWNITPFETIHDVYTNDKRGIVVVGNPKNGKSPIFYEKPNTITFKVFRDDWYEIPIEYHGFSEVLSVCYTGTRWIFVGVPISKWMLNGIEVPFGTEGAENVNDGKILAHTTDLLDPDTWVIENFTDINEKPFDVIKVTSNSKSDFGKSYFNNVSSWQGNHVRPVNYKGNSGVIINVSFYDDDPDITAYYRLQEKVYFMYDNGSSISIKQNDSFPEPTLIYRDQLEDAFTPWETKEHGGEQFRPTWETYINNEIRTLFNTVYKHSFNQYVVDCNAKGEFFLNLYNHPYSIDHEGESTIGVMPWLNRYRKFITTDTFSLRNRIEGNCYKIEQVKNENFITGVDSVRYLAVGKGISSPIVKSDDLINWTDVDVKDIFTIVFDISHKSGLWVAIGEGNYNLAISKDGKNWTGIYAKYQSDTLSSDYSTTFNSLDYYNNTDDNVTDVLPYIPNLKGIFLRNLSILRLFSRIEYHVGAQIWQTLTFDDIKAMLDTEFGAGEYAKLLKNCSTVNKNGSTKLTTWIPGFTKTLSSKLETFVNVSENGSFPSGLLKDQKLSIKVYYNNLENVIGNELTSSDMNNAVFDNFMNNTLIPCDRDQNYFIDSFLADNYGFQLGDKYQNVNGQFKLNFSTEIQRLRLYCKQFELDEVEINEFNKGVKQVPKITQSLYFDADNVGNMSLDLDNFNMYASHIIVSGWLTSDVYIKDMNLELNGYSYNKTMEPSAIDFATKLCLGLNYNRYTFNGVDKEDGIGSLVIPLASTAYSGSSVPLDRYSSIRLKLNFNAIAGPRSYINVTCVGTTVVSYNNSTANIDLF